MEHWPQYTMLALFATSTVIGCSKEAVDRDQSKQAAVIGIVLTLFLNALFVWVLKAGNFFAPLGWPS